MTMRPLFRRLLAGLLPLLIVIVAWQVWDHVEARRFAGVAARIEARQRPGAVPPRDNVGWDGDEAGRHYAAAAIAFNWPRPTAPISVSSIVETYRNAANTGTVPDPQAVALARTWLTDNESPLGLFDRASSLEFRGLSAGTKFAYQTGNFSSLHQLASLRTLDLLVSGNVEAATRSLVTRLRALRVFAEQPAWAVVPLRQIIDDSTVVLSNPQAGPEAWDRFQVALREVEVESQLQSVLMAKERSTYEVAVQVFAFGQSSRSVGQLVLSYISRPLLRRRAIETLEADAEAIEAAAGSWPQRIEALRQVRPPDTSFERALTVWAARDLNPYEEVRMRSNPYAQVAVTQAAHLAKVRAMGLALAAERALRQLGTLPDGIDAVDPFTGSQLKYVNEGDNRFVIYSVGENGRDDGGMVDGVRRQPGEALSAPLDVGVRMRVAR